jgi:hypothetical protein
MNLQIQELHKTKSKYQKEQRDEARLRRARQPVAIGGEPYGKQFSITAQIHGAQASVVVI